MNCFGLLRGHLSFDDGVARWIAKARHPVLLMTATQHCGVPEAMRFRGQVTQIGNCAIFCKRAASVGIGAVTIEANVLFEKRRAHLNGLFAESLIGWLWHRRYPRGHCRERSGGAQLKGQQARRSSLGLWSCHRAALAEESRPGAPTNRNQD